MIFLALVHGQPELCARFLKTLYPHKVVLHIDRKADHNLFQDLLKTSNHVQIIPRHESYFVNWGGFSVVCAMKLLLKKGVEIASENEKLVFVSGQDYLLKPVSHLERYLNRETEFEFARYYEIKKNEEPHYGHIRKLNFHDVTLIKWSYNSNITRLLNGLWRRTLKAIFYPLTRRRFFIPKNIAVGSQWIAISKECASYILSMNTKKLDRQLRFTWFSDEKYFQTLISQSPFHRFTPAKGFEMPSIAPDIEKYRMLHHLREDLKGVFVIADKGELLNSSLFLVRKVSLPESKELLDFLDDINQLQD